MPGAKHGLKFVKVFGANPCSNGGCISSEGVGYANTTFGIDYGGHGEDGSMDQVSFGDGSAKDNDTGNVINFSGEYPQWIGRSFGSAQVMTPQNKDWAAANWGDSWHHFKLHVKYNSGTTAQDEKADGEYSVEIDGVTYVEAKGLFNRNPSNLPIDRVTFFDWTQNNKQPFEVWLDDIRISTGGFLPS